MTFKKLLYRIIADQTPYLPNYPLAAFQAGQVVDVPIILGTVANESNLFINYAFTKPVGDVEYYAVMGVILGLNSVEPIAKEYPVPNPPPADYRTQLYTIATDALFVCPTRNATASLANSPTRKSPVYLYMYNHLQSFAPAMWGNDYPFNLCWNAVCHAAELVELFHPVYPAFGTNYTAGEVSLSTRMDYYWTNFAATGAPGTGAPGLQLAWPAYNTTYRPVMNLDVVSYISQDKHGQLCDFWDSLGYNFY